LSADDHRFGGEWTEIKLAVLDAYSGFFTTALQFQDFKRWYIDGFAGTGRRVNLRQAGGLFEAEPLETKEETLEGSARRALAIHPPYHHLVLIDARKSHAEALEAIAREFPDRDVRPIRGDANDVIPKLLLSPPWIGREAGAQRALVFLDPYGINVDFTTLQALAACQRADVWLLVNLKAVVQQLAHDHKGLDDSKRQSISRFLGSDTWESQFYAFRKHSGDLFSQVGGTEGERVIDRYDVAKFYRAQLQKTFRYVSEPLSLKVGSQDDYFQLYCMSNNPSEKAQQLIKRGAESILRKFAASRRTSFP